MARIVCIAVVISLFVNIHCVDRTKLKLHQKPAPNFDLHSWARGTWFTQARYVPCSFSGSKQFSNIATKNTLKGDQIIQETIWRNRICSKVTTSLSVLESGCGVFIQRDPLGGMVTGDQVVVEYSVKKGYHISWGCTKRNIIDGTCDDPLVLVKTRKPFPAQYVWECVVKDLDRLFGMTLGEMSVVSHKNPC